MNPIGPKGLWLHHRYDGKHTGITTGLCVHSSPHSPSWPLSRRHRPLSRRRQPRPASNNAWATYSYQSDEGPVCYISSVPTAFNPSEGVNHGDIFFLVSNKPAANVPLEPSFRAAGYEF